jgi:hypothetical protein
VTTGDMSALIAAVNYRKLFSTAIGVEFEGPL